LITKLTTVFRLRGSNGTQRTVFYALILCAVFKELG